MPKVRVRNNRLQLDGEPTYEPFQEVDMTEEKASMYVSMGLVDLMREETVTEESSRVFDVVEGTNTLVDVKTSPEASEEAENTSEPEHDEE